MDILKKVLIASIGAISIVGVCLTKDKKLGLCSQELEDKLNGPKK